MMSSFVSSSNHGFTSTNVQTFLPATDYGVLLPIWPRHPSTREGKLLESHANDRSKHDLSKL